MKEGFELIFGFIVSGFFLVYFLYSIYLLYKSKGELFEIITNYYQEKELVVTRVLKLNIRESLRYGAPIIPFLSFISYSNDFFRRKSDIDYVRKVELEDSEGRELTKYVEIIVEKKEVVSFKEIDSYDI